MRKRNRKGQYISWWIKRAITACPCFICGSRHHVQVDHIIPLSRGGTSDIENLQPLCRYHNGAKGNRAV